MWHQHENIRACTCADGKNPNKNCCRHRFWCYVSMFWIECKHVHISASRFHIVCLQAHWSRWRVRSWYRYCLNLSCTFILRYCTETLYCTQYSCTKVWTTGTSSADTLLLWLLSCSSKSGSPARLKVETHESSLAIDLGDLSCCGGAWGAFHAASPTDPPDQCTNSDMCVQIHIWIVLVGTSTLEVHFTTKDNHTSCTFVNSM